MAQSDASSPGSGSSGGSAAADGKGSASSLNTDDDNHQSSQGDSGKSRGADSNDVSSTRSDTSDASCPATSSKATFEIAPCDMAALFAHMQISAAQLATFEAGLQALLSSQKATYTVDGKRVSADQLSTSVGAQIGRALDAHVGVRADGGRADASVHSRGLSASGPSRFLFKVRRRLF